MSMHTTVKNNLIYYYYKTKLIEVKSISVIYIIKKF